MHRLIISCPFGNHFYWPGVTSTIGTYTSKRRAGTLLRMWRIFRTVRYWPRIGAWVNRLGLPSPGIDALAGDVGDKVLSIHGFDLADWNILAYRAVELHPLAVELNVSCPNVAKDRDMLEGAISAARILISSRVPVIAKLPPVRWFDLAGPLHQWGVRIFHLCNTIPSPGGGLSGKPLKQYSLWAIEEFRKRWGNDVRLIGGGGVTTLEDVQDYISAGADHLAVGSMLFNPFNWRKIPEFRDYLEGRFPA